MNYFLDDKINKAEILFPGVGCFLIAVCLGSCVHTSNAADNKSKLDHFASSKIDGSGYTSVFTLLNIVILVLFEDVGEETGTYLCNKYDTTC